MGTGMLGMGDTGMGMLPKGMRMLEMVMMKMRMLGMGMMETGMMGIWMLGMGPTSPSLPGLWALLSLPRGFHRPLPSGCFMGARAPYGDTGALASAPSTTSLGTAGASPAGWQDMGVPTAPHIHSPTAALEPTSLEQSRSCRGPARTRLSQWNKPW